MQWAWCFNPYLKPRVSCAPSIECVVLLVTSVVFSEPGVSLPPGRPTVGSASPVKRAALRSLRGPERQISLHIHEGPADRRRKMSTGSDGASRPRAYRPPGSPKENLPVQVTRGATGPSSLPPQTSEYFAVSRPLDRVRLPDSATGSAHVGCCWRGIHKETMDLERNISYRDIYWCNVTLDSDCWASRLLG
jgi:hypothetical protein